MAADAYLTVVDRVLDSFNAPHGRGCRDCEGIVMEKLLEAMLDLRRHRIESEPIPYRPATPVEIAEAAAVREGERPKVPLAGRVLAGKGASL